jgi:hypothetical protein
LDEKLAQELLLLSSEWHPNIIGQKHLLRLQRASGDTGILASLDERTNSGIQILVVEPIVFVLLDLFDPALDRDGNGIPIAANRLFEFSGDNSQCDLIFDGQHKKYTFVMVRSWPQLRKEM